MSAEYVVSSLDALGTGPGFRKVRQALGVEAFGVNAIVLPPGMGGNFHWHDEQEELYFVHTGEVEFAFGDGRQEVVLPGGLVRVDAHVRRKYRNVGATEAVVLCIGGKGGYVGRDGRADEGELGASSAPPAA